MNGSEQAARFARKVFLIAGVYGVIVVSPLYFFERRIAQQAPPAITHPEFFYGFLGTTLVWQFVYLLISTDPARFRPVMLLGVLAKVSYGTAVAVLFAQHRLAASTFYISMVDLLLATLFLISFVRMRSLGEPPGAAR